MIDFKLPNFNDNQLDDAKERKQIKEYLVLLTRQLKYILNNIDVENLASGLSKSISDNGAAVTKVTQDLRDIGGAISKVEKNATQLGLNAENHERSCILVLKMADSELARVTIQFTGNFVTDTQLEQKGYVTDTELEQKGYVTATALEQKGYVTATALEQKGYVTATALEQKGYVTATELEQKGYVTDTELEQKGYVTDTELEQNGVSKITGATGTFSSLSSASGSTQLDGSHVASVKLFATGVATAQDGETYYPVYIKSNGELIKAAEAYSPAEGG